MTRVGLGNVEGGQRQTRIKNYCIKMRVLSDGHWVRNYATDENGGFCGSFREAVILRRAVAKMRISLNVTFTAQEIATTHVTLNSSFFSD